MATVPSSAVTASTARRSNTFYGLITKYPAVALIAGLVAIISVLYRPARFADYYQYLVITDGLYYFASNKWLDFETGSNLLFLLLRLLTGNTVYAVNLAHYLLAGAYIYFYFRFAEDDYVGWRGILLSFGLYGALLAFVTIRATPAYLLVTLAALDAARGRLRAVPLALAGSLFHVSALLAVVPIALAVAQNRLRALHWVGQSTRGFSIIIALLLVAFGAARALFANTLNNLVSSIPFLNKYDVYTASLDPLKDTGQSGGLSTGHLLYAGLMTVLAVGFILMRDERCRRLRLYVVASYALFLMLEFAPVTAYRQSQYWAIPAMLVFPWQLFAPAGFRAILFSILCVGMFAFALIGVIT